MLLRFEVDKKKIDLQSYSGCTLRDDKNNADIRKEQNIFLINEKAAEYRTNWKGYSFA